MINNLNDYYNSKGQTLPSVQDRMGVATQADIQNYTGTAQQNQQPSAIPVTGVTKQETPIQLPTQNNSNNLGVINPIQNNQNTPVQNPTFPNYADQAIKNFDLSPTEKGAMDSQSTIIANQLASIAGLGGQTQALYDAQNAQGVPQLKQDLQKINSQILQKQAEINQDDIKLVANMRNAERHDTLLPFAQADQAKLAGDAQIIRALKNAEIGVLNATALAKQGDIQLAMDTAKQAVDLKYAPYKDQIEIGKAQLEAIKPFLDAAEKKQAKALDLKATLAMKEIDNVSTFQKDALKNALTNGAPQSVISAINSAGSIEDITKAGGQYIVSAADRLDLAIKQAQLAKLKSELPNSSSKTLQTVSDIQDKISNINGILNSSAIGSVIGPSILTRGAGTFGGVLSRFATGATGGAIAGGTAGSVIPGVGTLIGGIAGGIAGGLTTASQGAIDTLTGNRQQLIGSVEQLVQQQFLDNLINVKAKGATFGALSDAEGSALRQAATKIGTWRITDKKGNVLGYNIDENNFKKEIETIKSLAIKAYEKSTGIKYSEPSPSDFWSAVDQNAQYSNYGNYSLN